MRGVDKCIYLESYTKFDLFLDRYSTNRYRGGGPSNAGNNRRRNSRSRSPRDRDGRGKNFCFIK